MLLKDKLMESAGSVLKAAGRGESVEVVAHRESASTLRFAGSSFHQGGKETDCLVYVRVVTGRKIGVASTNSLEAAELKDCLERAMTIARHTGKEPFEFRLPGPAEYARVDSWSERSSSVTEQEKAQVLSGCFKRAASKGAVHSGALTTAEGEVAVLNSNGISAYHPYSSAHLSAVASRGDVTGYASAISNDFYKIDIPAVLDRAVEDCLMGLDPTHIEPGVYRVLFSPHAVSELLDWLSYTGFGAKNFHEGTSFLSGRLGDNVTGDNVTIYDDGLSPSAMSIPFDMEGVAKKRLPIIEKGVARAVAYDSFTAAIERTLTTGHAGAPDETEGPFPEHLFMEGGTMDTAEMLEMLGDGIFVKSFHYVNGLLNPREGLMTGMTRHGTFLVEGGRVKRALHPLRFTENIVKAFERIEALSKTVEVFEHRDSSLSSISVPNLLISSFRFTS